MSHTSSGSTNNRVKRSHGISLPGTMDVVVQGNRSTIEHKNAGAEPSSACKNNCQIKSFFFFFGCFCWNWHLLAGFAFQAPKWTPVSSARDVIAPLERVSMARVSRWRRAAIQRRPQFDRQTNRLERFVAQHLQAQQSIRHKDGSTVFATLFHVCWQT